MSTMAEIGSPDNFLRVAMCCGMERSNDIVGFSREFPTLWQKNRKAVAVWILRTGVFGNPSILCVLCEVCYAPNIIVYLVVFLSGVGCRA